MGSRLTLTLVAALLVGHPVRPRAIILPLTRTDMARAIGLARWPHTDAERARFHARYEVRPAPETPFAFTVERVEIVTAFRRLELMAEAHQRLNDSWGRAGLGEVELAVRPYQRQLSVIAHLRCGAVVVVVPTIDVVLGEPPIERLAERQDPLYDSEGTLIGVDIEAHYDADRVGQTVQAVTISSGERTLARAQINLGALN